MPAEELRITLTLSVDEVHWPQVLELLTKRNRLSFRQADAILQSFFERFLKPFNLYWFTKDRLSPEDNKLAAAICECHGADTIIMTVERPFRAGPIRSFYQQSISFAPQLRASEQAPEGRCAARIELSVFGRTHVVSSLSEALFLYAVFSFVGVFSFVFAMGAFLYSLAVFLLFLDSPDGITEAATKDPTVGLALLCFLVATAAIFGRAVSNLANLAYKRIRKGLRSH